MNLVCIITALPAESRVFVDALKLRHVHVRGLRLYSSERFLLLQTGIGKLRAAAATAALLQVRPDVTAVINAGIAGGTEEVGSVHLAHRILDVATGWQWFPHLPPQRTVARLSTLSIHSVDNPTTDYADEVLFDMEAAGIATAASAYLSTDAVHAVKVVSDNPEQPLETVSPAIAAELMPACLPVVQQLADWHGSRRYQQSRMRDIHRTRDAILTTIRHSVSDTHQLSRLLQQYLTLTGELPELQALQAMRSARQLRAHLQQVLAATELRYEH